MNPRLKKLMVLPTTPFVKVISGVLVCLTTCKRLTHSLPKLSLITVGQWVDHSISTPTGTGNNVGRVKL